MSKEDLTELPTKEANPALPKKGFRAQKKATKGALQQENNALKTFVNQVQQTQQFMGQQLFQLMQQVRGSGEQVQSLANLLRCTALTTEQKIEAGDTVMLDFSGILTEDGLPFEGGFMMGSVLKLSSGQFIDEFEKQIIGGYVGTTGVFTLTFPKDYPTKLAEKEAEFTVRIVNAWRSPEDDNAVEILHNKRLEAKKAALEATQPVEEAKEKTLETTQPVEEAKEKTLATE